MKKIVLVESDAALRESMARFLSRQGFSVRDFSDLREAVAFLDRHPREAHAAVWEVFPPGNNPVPITDLARRKEGPPSLAVTAALPRDPFKLIGLGLNTFYQKPVDMKAVHDTIHNLIKDRIEHPRLKTEYYGFLSDTCIQSGLRSHILSRLEDFGFDAKKANGIVLAIDEIYTNAVLHGNFGLGSRKDDPERWDETYRRIQEAIENPRAPASEPYLSLAHKKVYVELKFAWRQALVTIRDEGKGFEWKRFCNNGAPQAKPSISGFGITIARRVMDEVLYNDEGNEVTMFATAGVTAAGPPPS